MKKWINTVLAITVSTMCLMLSSAIYATAIFNIVPNSRNPIIVYPTVDEVATYYVTNNTKNSINSMIINPYFNLPKNRIIIKIQQDTCSNQVIIAGGTCMFQLSLRGKGEAPSVVLMPRVCSNDGLLCSVPVEKNRILITFSALLNPIYTFHTNMGDIRVELFATQTPNTVANFLYYINSGAYNNSIIHRSVTNFVIQGGGFTVNLAGTISQIIPQAPIQSEAGISNTRGTIAMALTVFSDPNSATSQWFFNLTDNPFLDGTYTVFGQIADNASLSVMDSIAALPTYDKSSINPAFIQLPLINYVSGTPQYNNYVVIPSFTSGE